MVLNNGKIPFKDKSIDIVWVCLVLGGIPEKSLNNVIKEFNRVLKNNGLLIVIENTSKKSYNNYWKCRTSEDYINLLSFVEMQNVGNYIEVDEQITIYAGRKKEK